MKIIVISSCDLIKEGIISVISKDENVSVQFTCGTVKEAMFMIKGRVADVIVLDIHEDNEFELDAIIEITALGTSIKLILLDFCGSSKLFIKALKYRVQGYIFGESNEEEIRYAINQVYEGKKYYDSHFIDCIINENLYY